MKKVFLGGTCNGSNWRKDLIPLLKIDYFDPVVKNWNKEAQEREYTERAEADFCLYTITPKMSGVYSIAEVVDDSNKRPDKTIFCLLSTDKYQYDAHTVTEGQLKSLEAVARLVEKNGAKVVRSLREVAEYVNG